MRRTILSVLALIVAVTFASRATAVEEVDALSGTKWKHNDSQSREEFNFEFTKNGLFILAIKDDKGTTQVKGLYSITGKTLRLKVIENGTVEVIEVTLRSLDKDQMVTKLGTRERQFYRAR